MKLLKEKLQKKEMELASFKERGDEKSAFYTLKKVIELKELLVKEERKKKLKDLEAFYASKEKDLMLAQEDDYKKKLEEKNEKLSVVLRKQKLMELQLESLQLQLSPHFIFNTMQSIQSYVFEQDPIEASDYLGKFAALMRGILSASRMQQVTVKSEIKLIRNYLEIEKIRFGDAFTFELQQDFKSDVEGLFMPPLLVQPFVENAIIHGLANIQNGKVSVVFRERNGLIYIHVYDNGIGRLEAAKFQKSTQQGPRSGLEILEDRQQMSRDASDFEYWIKVGDRVRDGKISGTYVLIKIKDLKRKKYG